ncbi:hypothetical protein BaRGS_00028738 [Batillaria attramentaria]|uniref:Uncharacterized protein n=1 Tax=Batillaria attramentaria TaxID=370345 RepID=A0ABD0JXY1_9CAEN
MVGPAPCPLTACLRKLFACDEGERENRVVFGEEGADPHIPGPQYRRSITSDYSNHKTAPWMPSQLDAWPGVT